MRIGFNVRLLMVPATVAALFALPAHAQYTGPSSINEGSVAAILADPQDDQAVQLQGHLLRRTSHDQYICSDGSGAIVAEIDDKRFPAQAVSEKTKEEILGAVDTGLTRPPE